MKFSGLNLNHDLHTMSHRRKTIVFVNIFFILVVFLPGLYVPVCHSSESTENPASEINLRIVIVPEKNSFEQLRRYKYLTDYLSQEMGMIVTVEIMANYGEISNAFKEGRADAGFFGSFSYVLTQAQTGIEPIARPVWLNGSTTYRGYIFVRKDSGIKTVADMKKKSLVLVDKATTAGYFYQLFYFKYYGITKLEDYFSRISFARSHDAAVWSVYTGESDIGGAKNHIYNEFKERYPDFKEQMLILAESPEVPSNGIAVSKDLNPAIRARLKNLLLTLHQDEKGQEILKNFGARRFVETTDSDYEVLYNMVKEMGTDLKNYSN
jgi:phosphonate transport system substrate-binding protein